MQPISEDKVMSEGPPEAEVPEGEKENGAQGEKGKAAAPYISYDGNINTKAVAVLASLTEVKEYIGKDCYRKTRVAVESLGLGPCNELMLKDGSGTALPFIHRRVDDASLPPKYYESVLQINLDLVGAASGVCLRGGWATRVSAGALVQELAAAHVVYNRKHGTTYAVIFEPDASRFDKKRFKEVPIIASTAPKKIVRDMQILLEDSSYGRCKYMSKVDAGGPSPPAAKDAQGAAAQAASKTGDSTNERSTGLQLSAGTWFGSWRDLDDIIFQFPVGLQWG
jgi:hypothetical protein